MSHEIGLNCDNWYSQPCSNALCSATASSILTLKRCPLFGENEAVLKPQVNRAETRLSVDWSHAISYGASMASIERGEV
jgi:hypothetical protein